MSRSSSQTGLLAALLCLLLLIALALQTSRIFPVDDAYISFRYARNLAAGDGLVFNPGERVEGFSNLLFTVLLSAAYKAGLTPPLAARLVNTASVVSIILLLLYAHPRPHPPLAARAAAALVLVSSGLTSANVLSGLEAPLTAALLLAAAILLENQKHGLACATLFLLSLARPEGIALAFFIYVAELARPSSGESKKEALKWAAALLFSYLAFLGWRYVYYRDLMPNSVRAKSGLTPLDLLRASTPYCKRFVAIHWPALITLFVGVFSFKRWTTSRYWTVLSSLIALALVSLVIGAGDPYGALLRYLYPALPLILLLVSRAAQDILRLAPRASPAASALIISVLVILFVLQAKQSIRPIGLARPASETSASAVLRLKRGLSDLLSRDDAPHRFDSFHGSGHHNMTRWLMDNAETDALIATGEIGILSYYTGARVLDLFGLVDKKIARLPRKAQGKEGRDYVFARAPDYIVPHAARPCTSPIAGLVADPRLSRDYELTQMFSHWARWQLLFKRRTEPAPVVAYDFIDNFRPGRVAMYDANGQPLDDTSRSATVALRLKSLESETLSHQQQSLKQAALEAPQASPETIAIMRRCLGQWKRWLIHESGTGDDAVTGISYQLRVPSESSLSFRLIRPPALSDPGCDGIRYDIWTRLEGGRKILFSQRFDPMRSTQDQRWVDFRIDMGTYAGEDMALTFVTASSGCRGHAGGWGEPLLIQSPPRL